MSSEALSDYEERGYPNGEHWLAIFHLAAVYCRPPAWWITATHRPHGAYH